MQAMKKEVWRTKKIRIWQPIFFSCHTIYPDYDRGSQPRGLANYIRIEGSGLFYLTFCKCQQVDVPTNPAFRLFALIE